MMTPWQRRQRNITAAQVIGGLLLTALLALTLYVAVEAFATERLRRHHEEAVDQLRRLLTALIDGETGVRGYVITGDPSYLEPYHWSIGAIGPMLDAIHPPSSGDTAGDRLRQLIEDRLAALAFVVDTTNEYGIDAAAIAVHEGGGKELMDQIRMSIGSEIDADSAAITELSQRAAADTALLGVAVAVVVVLGAALSIYQFWVFRAEIARRGHTEVELQARNTNIHLLSELANARCTRPTCRRRASPRSRMARSWKRARLRAV
jgi:CHASE3 domain sensor protein